MLTKLRNRYKQGIILNQTPQKHKVYEWFLSEKQDLIGIEKALLSTTEYEMLTLFLTPIQPSFSASSKTHEQWGTFLYDKQTEEEKKTFLNNMDPKTKSVQFLHFHTPKAFFEKEEFEEALTGLVMTPFLIIWRDYSNGVILLFNSHETNEHLEYEQIIRAIQSDFLIDLAFFVGKIYTPTVQLYTQFLFEQQCFQYGLIHKRKQPVSTLADIIPEWTLSHLNPDDRRQLRKNLLGDVAEDTDLLETVKVFIECNLNLSLTAKTLFLHRNSVQYRIDRFIEKTGIDIKQFRGALIVYLTYF